MKAKDRLNDWFRKLAQSNGRMNREDVCFLMVQARHLIESSATPDKYRITAFYADWTVHSAIDRSVVCFEVLRDVTRVLVENIRNTRSDFPREISRIIGFPKLRSELKGLFNDYGLPTIIFDYRENWSNFVSFLLWSLAGQPIGFPKNPTGKSMKIKDEIIAIQKPYDISVEALAIINHENTYHWNLVVSGDKEFNILGQVEIAESDDAFLSPP
jgi:hypothetical protein